MSYQWSDILTQTIDIQNNIRLNSIYGNEDQVPYTQGGIQVWKKINGLTARFTDTTDGVQDLNVAPIEISFDTENYNFANIGFGGNKFELVEPGFYYCSFSCLLSNSGAQTLIMFFLNDKPHYGNLSTFINGTSERIPFLIETVIYSPDSNAILTVKGEKYNNGPNYLSKEPIYGTAATQLIITKI